MIKRLIKENILDKVKIIKKQKDYILLQCNYNFGDIKYAIDGDNQSDTLMELTDELDQKTGKTWEPFTVEEIERGKIIEVELGTI